MSAVTAQQYAYVRVRQPEEQSSWGLACAVPPQAVVEALPSDGNLGSIATPVVIPAQWIGTIQQRIQRSILGSTVATPDEGGWLDFEIARHALYFFDATSDVLPTSEPYLYTTSDGDLVAEFAGRHSKLTAVISKAAVQSYAIVDGQMIKSTLTFPFDDAAKARQELMQITNQL